ncbi:DNRLRE domain-containing protein [Botrimarina mediterranea]|uniref:PEP-CTERM protein-sorting domain-containing protein n=1 Tax=Botrimarina mediterranea TaxID=2528022 RepID=A0A518K801_9BACT|nr:DNRLRE domain-containing protein [Botrimarina mediterranea]QDV73916.1 hypothetical protein Spa11_21150 [Botrimarina mediterranea]
MRVRPAILSRSAAKTAAASAVLAMTGASAFAVTGTVAFQQGIDGYTGTANRVIDERIGTSEFDGATVERYFLDGYSQSSNSPDVQGLFRFDNIIGGGAGQIPAGAYVLEANFQIMTSFAGNAQTNGPFAVSGLLAPFDNNTSYIDFPGGRGPWWQDGTATRPAGSFSGNQPGQVAITDIRSLVQDWADNPSTNYGVAVAAGFPGTSDGWGINSPGHSFPEFRPRLSVTYTTEPITERVFQRGLNGYDGNTMIRMNGGADINDPSDDETTDGLTYTQEFLDGADYNSNDVGSLIKFDDVFGAGANQSPADVPVAKAWMVLTVGDLSTAAGSPGDWHVHAMKQDWDTTSLYSDFDLGFNPEKPTDRLGADIGPALDTIQGVNLGSELWFDVTSYLEGVRNGADDFGLAVLAGTPDGIQIHFNGSDLQEARPRLVVASGMIPVVGPTLAGDFNNDGVVNAADYTVYRDNLNTSFDLGGNGDESGGSAGVVDAADYALWSANYGATAGGNGLQAVPEPMGVMLVGAGLAMTFGRSRRR